MVGDLVRHVLGAVGPISSLHLAGDGRCAVVPGLAVLRRLDGLRADCLAKAAMSFNAVVTVVGVFNLVIYAFHPNEGSLAAGLICLFAAVLGKR